MDDQNKKILDELLSGLSPEQRSEFETLAKETLAARVLERIVSTLTEAELEEMKALPENDPTAVEVFLQDKFSKEEMEQMAREEVGFVRERLMATAQEVNTALDVAADAQDAADAASDELTKDAPGA